MAKSSLLAKPLDGDEIVTRSLVDWVFNGKKGEIGLSVQKEGKSQRCVLRFGPVKNGRGVVTIRRTK